MLPANALLFAGGLMAGAQVLNQGSQGALALQAPSPAPAPAPAPVPAPTPAAAPVNLQGTIVAGPVIAGNELKVNVYAASGELLASGIDVDDEGRYQLSVRHTGVVTVVIYDVDSDPTRPSADYMDEAGGPVDLPGPLRALVVLEQGAANLSANVTPLTEIAASLATGQSADQALAAGYRVANASALTVRQSNRSVAQLFGLGADLDVTQAEALPVTDRSGNPVTAINDYGRVLAAISHAGSIQQVIQALVAGISFDASTGQSSFRSTGGAGANAQALLAQGLGQAELAHGIRYGDTLAALKTQGERAASGTLLSRLQDFEAERLALTSQWKSLSPAPGASMAEVRLTQALREWATAEEAGAPALQARLQAATQSQAQTQAFWQDQLARASTPADKARVQTLLDQQADAATAQLAAQASYQAQLTDALRVINSPGVSAALKLQALAALDQAMNGLHRLATAMSDQAAVQAADVQHLGSLQGAEAVAWTERLVAQSRLDRLMAESLSEKLAQTVQAQRKLAIAPQDAAAQAMLAEARLRIEQLAETQADTALQRAADARVLSLVRNDPEALARWKQADADQQYAQQVLSEQLQRLVSERQAAQAVLDRPDATEAQRQQARQQIEQLQARIDAQQQAHGQKVGAQALTQQQLIESLDHIAELQAQIERASGAEKAALEQTLAQTREQVDEAREMLEQSAAIERTRARALEDTVTLQAEAAAAEQAAITARAQAQASVQQATAAKAQALSGLSSAVSTQSQAQQQLTAAQAQLQTAETERQAALQTRDQAQAALRQAQGLGDGQAMAQAEAALQQAQEALQGRDRALTQARQAQQQAQARLELADQAVTQAQAALTQAESGILEAQAQADTAQADATRARQVREAALKQQQALEQTDADQAAAQALAAQAREQTSAALEIAQRELKASQQAKTQAQAEKNAAQQAVAQAEAALAQAPGDAALTQARDDARAALAQAEQKLGEANRQLQQAQETASQTQQKLDQSLQEQRQKTAQDKQQALDPGLKAQRPRQAGVVSVRAGPQTLRRKFITSPSSTTHSLPSFLAFTARLARALGGLLAVECDTVVKGGGLGADEAALEVAVLGLDDLDAGDGSHLARHVDDVRVVEAAHHVHDGIGLTDVRKELVRPRGRGLSKALVRFEVAPLARCQAPQRHPTDAQTPHALDLQAHGLAQPGDLPGLFALERKAQPRLALPADLAGTQGAPVKQDAVVRPAQPLDAPRLHRAADFHHHLVLHEGSVLAQLANDPPVLRENHQPAGPGRQRRHQRLLLEVALQRRTAARSTGPVLRTEPVRGGGAVRQRTQPGLGTSGLVQQKRDRHQVRKPRVGVDLDALVEHAGLRRFDHPALDRDPAAFDVLLGLATRAPHELGHPLGQANGLIHGRLLARVMGRLASGRALLGLRR